MWTNIRHITNYFTTVKEQIVPTVNESFRVSCPPDSINCALLIFSDKHALQGDKREIKGCFSSPVVLKLASVAPG